VSDSNNRVLIDATMLLRWRYLAPVGIVRLERLLSSHLRFRSGLGRAEFIVWSNGYRPAEDHEIESLDVLLTAGALEDEQPTRPELSSPGPTSTGRFLPAMRRTGLKTLGRMPGDVRPFAEQAAWSFATFGFESARYAKRTWRTRSDSTPISATSTGHHVRHRVNFDGDTDLVALGLGWEYLDHEAMYRLKVESGVRIHMPAFDLIPVLMPQMNAGQSHLVHRYYAEMAHYADSITSISYATRDALRTFFSDEMLPEPFLAVNQLPGFPADDTVKSESNRTRSHRLGDQQFVLSVSTVEVRKNHLLLAKLWAELLSEGAALPKLVIVGRIGWDVNELIRWAEYAPELVDGLVILSDVDDDELIELYKAAMFTVFPSRVEGWGLPITESLTYGKVCLHSTDPAQLEASQELMPALHPDDFLGWKAEVLRLCSDAHYLAGLERRIAEEFTPRTPDQYCADFEKIMSDRRAEVDS